MFSIWIFIFLVTLNMIDVDSQVHYEYNGPLGPNNWYFLFGGCRGKRQSPIDLSALISKTKSFPPIRLYNYYFSSSSQILTNTGHTASVAVTLPLGLFPTIEGGGLPNRYKLADIHFHWGSGYAGSEHTIEGKQSSMEMHLVHIGMQFNTLKEALNYDNGVAVLGILFEISNYDNPYLNPLIHGLIQVVPKGSSAQLRYPLEVDKLLPRNLISYFRYKGSLTSPTCNEGVVWTVFNTLVTMSGRQLHAFRQLTNNGHNIVDNVRPRQPLNGRHVYKVHG